MLGNSSFLPVLFFLAHKSPNEKLSLFVSKCENFCIFCSSVDNGLVRTGSHRPPVNGSSNFFFPPPTGILSFGNSILSARTRSRF